MVARKHILKEGSSKPEEHDGVIIEVSVSLNEKTSLNNYIVKFDLGFAQEFNVAPFFDNVVKCMKLYEEAVFMVELADLSDVDIQLLNLTANDSDQISITVWLKNIQKLNQVWQISEEEKSALADLMKKRGNNLLQSNELARAFRTYKKGIYYLENSVSVTKTAPNSSVHYSPTAVRLLAESLANASLCLLRIVCPLETSKLSEKAEPSLMIKDERTRKLLNMCVSYCQKAVALEPAYVKALFRLGKAYAFLCDYPNAIKVGERCISVLKTQSSPQTNALLSLVQSQLSTWRTNERKELERERSIFRKNTVKFFSRADSWAGDDDSDEDRLPVSVWSNDLAANMMSLHEELEAFGEKMPELRRFNSSSLHSRQGKHSSTLPALPDDDFEESSEDY